MGLLRFLLALSVIFAHTGGIGGVQLVGGVVAVETFYLISGFYMVLILHERYIGPGSYRRFITNRFLRIYPAYWVVLGFTILCWIGFWISLDSPGPFRAFTGEAPFLVSALLVVSQLLIVGQDAIYFLGFSSTGHVYFATDFHATQPYIWWYLFMPQAWTLSIELMFYLIAPCVVRWRVSALVTLMVGLVAARFYYYAILKLDRDPWTYRFFPLELAFFVAGALAYRVFRKLKNVTIARGVPTIVAVSFFTILIGIQYVPILSVGSVSLNQWAFYLLAWAAIPVLFRWSGSNRIDRYIGELSYPLYISHYILAVIVGTFIKKYSLHWNYGLVTTVASVLFSMLVLKCVMDPIEVIRRRRSVGG